MTPFEADLLAARLARMKYLIDALEVISVGTAEQRDLFLRLKQDLEAARLTVSPREARKSSNP
jgi:hypothetical protein